MAYQYVTKTGGERRVRPLFRVTQVVWYVLGIVEALLFIRFLLLLLDANGGAAFTRFALDTTYGLAWPFLAVFPSTKLGGMTWEWSTLLAMLVYWGIAWAIVRLVTMARPVSQAEADAKLSSQDIDG